MLLWQAGVDPGTGVLSGRALGEVGWGDFDYRRLRGSVAATRSLFLGLAGAVEVGAGATWGDAPVQRHFYIGGSRTLRGFRTGELSGPSFWFARAEVSSDFPGARIGLFGDLGKLAPRRELDFRDPLATIGVGASFLDGLFRMDLARILRGGNEFRFHVYLDGLL